MSGVYSWCFSRGISCEYEKIDNTEAFNDGVVHVVPDYFVTINGEKRTYEIKCSTTDGFTTRGNDEFIFVKPQAIWTMLKNRVDFPNGKLLVATSRKFSLLLVDEVNTYQVEEIPEWGGKKAYVIPTDKLQWNEWVVPLDLTT